MDAFILCNIQLNIKTTFRRFYSHILLMYTVYNTFIFGHLPNTEVLNVNIKVTRKHTIHLVVQAAIMCSYSAIITLGNCCYKLRLL